MVKDALLLAFVYLISGGLQLIAWPWLFRINQNLSDRGYALGRVLTSLAVALFVWTVSSLSIPANTTSGVSVTLLILILLTWRVTRKEIAPAMKFLREHWQFPVIEEVLFFSGLVGYGLIRGFQPDILGLEKFMDFGFIRSYLSSPTLPAPDMWWAGGAINYYSFGHFWTSILIRIWGVKPEVGYNIMLSFIMGNGLALSFSAAINLLNEKKASILTITAGVMAALLTTLGGNSHTLWSFLVKSGFTGYWYADATRFIPFTIHEFPAYSFVVSDLHGHVADLPIVLAFLITLISWARARTEDDKPRALAILMGVGLGLMAMTNTWDSAIYGLLLATCSFLLLISEPKQFLRLITSGLVVGISAILTALIWLTGFQSIASGVVAVAARSEIWRLLVLWTMHLMITLTAIAAALWKKRTDLLVIALGLTAVTLLVIPEFIFVKDIYPSHPRANTMFKLTYQAFIIMSLLFGFIFGKLGKVRNRLVRTVAGLGFTGVFGVLMVFPFLSFPTYYNNFREYRGLSGDDFLSTRFPNDLAIIRFLEANRDGRNMIEAVGDSYTETDFVSAFSGVPTVVGWRVHEWLWRGGYDAVGKREGEVVRFYEGSNEADREDLIKKYNVGWIIISPREREKYRDIKEAEIKKMGEIFNFGSSSLVKIRP